MRRTLAALALTLALPGPALLAPPASAQAVVVVREGDTLSDIAERHGVGLTRLMQANGISDPDLVVVGQRLTIPGSSGGSSSAATRSPRPTAPYTVKSGETLSDIATRFDTSTERLIQLNGLRNPDLVMSGTRLQVPVAPRRQTARPAAAPTRPAAPDRNARQHVVESGESLSVIAGRYGTTVEQLVALNRIEDPDRLLAGTRLQLRGAPPAPAARPVASPQQAAQAQSQAQSQPQPQAQPQPQTQVQPQSQSQPQTRSQIQAQTHTSTEPAAAPRSQPAAVTPTRASTPTPSRSEPDPASSTTISKARATTAPAATPAATPEPRTRLQSQSPVQTTSVQPASVRTTAPSTSRIAAATQGVPPTQAGSAPTARSTTSTASTTAAKGAATRGDWRSYGPLQIDWANWQSMGGSYVAPSLNSDGKARYLAVNCTARKLNTTTPAGQWNSWESPGQDFEKKLVQDICKEKGS